MWYFIPIDKKNNDVKILKNTTPYIPPSSATLKLNIIQGIWQ